MAVTPSESATSALAYDRKSVSQRRRTSNSRPSRDSNRHQQVQELAAVGGADHRRFQRVASDGETVRITRRNEAAVVRELALDESRRQADRTDLERRVAIAEP